MKKLLLICLMLLAFLLVGCSDGNIAYLEEMASVCYNDLKDRIDFDELNTVLCYVYKNNDETIYDFLFFCDKDKLWTVDLETGIQSYDSKFSYFKDGEYVGTLYGNKVYENMNDQEREVWSMALGYDDFMENRTYEIAAKDIKNCEEGIVELNPKKIN